MKLHDNGCFFTVTFNSDDTQAFSDSWPCSDVCGSGSFQFAKRNGDLVDAPQRATSDAWVAFMEDCRKWGEKAMADAQKPRYRKNSIEAKLDSLLPQFPSYDVIAHELWAGGEGSWSVNDSWHLARGCDREYAIMHLANRWQVFKANYAPKARVRDLTDANWSGDEFPSLLEADCIAFAEVRNGGHPHTLENDFMNAETPE